MHYRSEYTKALMVLLFLAGYGLLTRTSLAAAPPDVVLYASDVTTIRGTWTRISSTTGAGKQLMSSTEAGGVRPRRWRRR